MPNAIIEVATMAAGADFGTTLHQIAQAILTVLAVINPVVCGSIFLTLTPNLESRQKRRAAVRAALSILVILVASAFIGLHVLSVFGISLDVFRIVGGVIIAYMGFDMLGGGQKIAQAPPSSGAGTDARNSLTPLVIERLAGDHIAHRKGHDGRFAVFTSAAHLTSDDAALQVGGPYFAAQSL